jgi:hypothetical protein
MQSAQVMHSSCWPSRMSMPMGQTDDAGIAIDAVADILAVGGRLLGVARTRLAAPVIVGDGQASFSSSIAAWMRGHGHI